MSMDLTERALPPLETPPSTGSLAPSMPNCLPLVLPFFNTLCACFKCHFITPKLLLLLLYRLDLRLLNS
jgi:hypothetical protein